MRDFVTKYPTVHYGEHELEIISFALARGQVSRGHFSPRASSSPVEWCYVS